jgi:rRNA-processing protein FCF1
VQRIIVDACGWVAVIDAGINIDDALLQLLGPSQLLLLPDVEKELEEINSKRSKKKSLLLQLLKAKTVMIDAPENSGNHPDDQILLLAINEGITVLTVDTDLKRRLFDSGIRIVEVAKNKRLNVIDNL